MSARIIGAGLGMVVIAGTLFVWRDRSMPREAGLADRVVVAPGNVTAPSRPAPTAAPTRPPAAAEAPAQVAVGDPPPLPEGLEGGFDPSAFAKSLRAERRDQQWAPGAEAGLRSSITRLPYMGPEANTLAVYCAATRCEASGKLPQASQENMNVAMMALQGEPLNDALKGAWPGNTWRRVQRTRLHHLDDPQARSARQRSAS
ncbi:hypothetical protein Q5H91_00900 [Sphingomonas sp. KR1UV-12]|uniref:Uncharacterized protein n=1 Tax=Sphingomonas aurea TaxID=3063994 RepID=A0ABT9EFZ3_9SPHN|nr:hypothetical protein [Sphingomonas sp. KR1UV-12]MDP1025760.1 hypothetical protein [Sphingomonas sp. KR1UV-12]